MPPRRRVLAALAALVLLPVLPLRADVLKTRDGAVVETKGPWTVKGKIVVFTHVNGTLSSLRLSEVDLEASEKATAAAAAGEATRTAEPVAPPAAPRREPVLVLTNADVPRARPAAATDGEERGPGLLPASAPLSETKAVVVVGWEAEVDPEAGGLEVFGTIQNQGREVAADLGLSVHLLDEAGEPVATSPASLTVTTLAARASTGFRAFFPGASAPAAGVRFSLSQQGVEIAPPAPSGAPPPPT